MKKNRNEKIFLVSLLGIISAIIIYVSAPSAFGFHAAAEINATDISLNISESTIYTIQSKSSNLFMENSGGFFIQDNYETTDAAKSGQQWQLVRYESNFLIMNRADGKVLEVPGGSTDQGSELAMASLNEGLNQQWQILEAGTLKVITGYPIPGKEYVIKSAASGQVVDIPGASTTAGTRLIQWSYNGDNNQVFTIAPGLSIIGTSEVSEAKMLSYILANYGPQPAYNTEGITLMVREYYRLEKIYGVRADIALAQAIHETGWYRYGGLVLPDQFNFAGIYATGSYPDGFTGTESIYGADPDKVTLVVGEKAARFRSVAFGVQAHVQHLYGYAKGEVSVDSNKDGIFELASTGDTLASPRYRLLEASKLGSAPILQGLAGKWAVPGTGYSNSLMKYLFSAYGASADSSLMDINMNEGTLQPGFDPLITNYTVEVDASVDTINISATASEENATVLMNGKVDNNQITLVYGNNTVNILVTAPDGTSTKTYTITVKRVVSSDAALSALTLSSGTLTPGFSSGATSYTASVANGVSSIKVTPTVNQANATVKVNGTTVASGSASGDIALAVGSNTVTVQVTAQDGITTKTYTVTVNRAEVQKDYTGTYNIRSMNSDLVMDVYGGGKDQGVNVIQWPYHGMENQQWEVANLNNGYYKITSVLSGMSIDVYGGGTDLGNRVIQWPYHGGTNQQWKLIENADGTISFMSRLAEESGTGYLLDVYGGGKDQGVNVIQWTAHYGENQKWYLEKVTEYAVTYQTDGGSDIASIKMGVQRLLTEPTPPIKSGVVFGGWYKDAALTQKWNFTKDRMPSSNLTLYAKWEKDNSGTWSIRSNNSQLLMDVYGGGKDQGVNVIQWPSNGGANQQWNFVSLGNGYYKITSVLSDLSLDVYGGNTDLGNRVIQWAYHGGSNQQWRIIENADGTVSLMSRLSEEGGSGYLLDVFGGGKDQGVNVIQWTAHYGDNQKWFLDEVK